MLKEISCHIYTWNGVKEMGHSGTELYGIVRNCTELYGSSVVHEYSEYRSFEYYIQNLDVT
jgi:hypothetical protein